MGGLDGKAVCIVDMVVIVAWEDCETEHGRHGGDSGVGGLDGNAVCIPFPSGQKY